MRAISLFSGAGGMDVGFKDSGFEIVAACEIDKSAGETFRANHAETLLIQGDINQHLSELGSFEKIDVVFGGPPCQGFSVAGKMDINDPRSKLIFSFCEVVERVKPAAFVLENVKSLGTLEKFEKIRNEFIYRMEKAGFSISSHILNAKDFGVPQARERVFFIGVKKDLKNISQFDFSKYKKSAPTLRNALINLGRPGTNNNKRICKAKITLATKPILRKSPYAGMLFNGQGRPLNPDGWASTLPASMGGNRTPIIDDNHLYSGERSWVEEYHKHLIEGGKVYKIIDAPSNLRRLTIDEAALLQTFPLGYIFLGPHSKIYSQIGNAVPCALAKVVASCVRNSLLGESFPTEVNPIFGENFQLSLI